MLFPTQHDALQWGKNTRHTDLKGASDLTESPDYKYRHTQTHTIYMPEITCILCCAWTPVQTSVENGVSGGETAAVISAKRGAQKHSPYSTLDVH